MKIAITGHTRGLGKAIYDHLVAKNYTVIGLSRANGYTLPGSIDQVIEVAKQCDYFFNNVHHDVLQAKLLERTFRFTKVITSSSIAADSGMIVNDPYNIAKLHVEQTHRRLKKFYGNYPMLLLKMGILEGNKNPKLVPIPYDQILAAVDVWMSNERISLIEFENELCR